MSEEFDSASRRTVSDEFLREEIGCCPEEVNILLEKRDSSTEPCTEQGRSGRDDKKINFLKFGFCALFDICHLNFDFGI